MGWVGIKIQFHVQHCTRHFFLHPSLVPQPRSLKHLSRQPRSYSKLHQRSSVGKADGSEVGEEEGPAEGLKVGEIEGLADGLALGIFVGTLVGNAVGLFVGIFEGILVDAGVLTYTMAYSSSLDSDRVSAPSVKTGM